MTANSNTLNITIEVDDKGSIKVKQFAGAIDESGKQVDKSAQIMSSSLGNLSGIIAKVAAGMALLKTADFIRDATMTAARYETLGVVLDRVGKNSAYTTVEIKQFEQGLRAAGIAGIETRVVLAQMIQSNIDLSKSTELARVAQDAAVIANLNSSETLERMMHAIQSNSVEIVRTIGLNVNFEDAVKRTVAQLGKTVEQLSESEKTQARLNAVIAAGVQISGAYESAMNTAGKQINSFKRYVQDFEVEFGKAFNPALTQIVFGASEALKVLTEAVKDPQFQVDMTKTANDISKSLVEGMQWLVDNRNNVKEFFGGIASGLSGIVSIMSKLPPEAWGALLGYKVGGVYGAAAGALGGLGYRAYSNIPTELEKLEAARRQLRKSSVEGEINWETGNMAAAELTVEQFMENMKRSAELRDRIDALMNTYPPFEYPKMGNQVGDRPNTRVIAPKPVAPPPSREALAAAKQAEDMLKRFQEDYRKSTLDNYEFERVKLDEQFKAYEKFVKDKAALNSWYDIERRKIDSKEALETAEMFARAAEEWEQAKAKPSRLEAWEAEQDKIRNEQAEKDRAAAQAQIDAYNNRYNYMIELSQRTAEALEKNFSDLFFDAFTGKLDSLQDYFLAFLTSIQRMSADIAGQMAKDLIFGKGAGGGGLLSGLGGLLSSYFGGGTPAGWENAWTHHAGGMAGSGAPDRMMPAWMIAHAPRFHSGLAPDEIPAVLQRGETVLPRGVPVQVSISVPINIASGGDVSGRLMNRMRSEVESTARRVLREEMR